MKYLKSILLILLLSSVAKSQIPTIQWQKSFGGSNNETAKSIVQTPDGGYITAGFSKSSDGNATINQGDNDFWVVKMDALGTFQWQKSLGGSGDDQANSICTTSDGGYVVAGFSNSSNGDITLNKGSSDYWIVKLNALGNIVWQKTYGGQAQDIATSVKQTTDGGYIVTGYSSSSNGDITGNHGQNTTDYWVVKLDSSGNLQWQKALGGTSNERAFEIQQTSDGGYIVSGDTYSSNSGDISSTAFGSGRDFWIVKLGSTGNITWEKRFGGSGEDNAYSISQTSDSGYIVSGTTTSINGNISFNNGQGDFWIIKLDALGNLQWEKALGSLTYDQAYSVKQTPDGNYIATGYLSSNTGVAESEPLASTQYWIVKLDTLGNLLWHKSYGGSGNEAAYSIISTTDGGLAVAGYSNTNPNSGDVTGNHGQFDFWILKLSGSKELGTMENNASEKPILYPNPTKDFVYINHLPKQSIVTIFDTVGRIVFSKKYSQKSISIETSAFANGVYIIQIDNEEKNILSEKLIIRK
ncbi:T9SS type A sorting domain-containing protein [Chryseobacterium defluvii]|uniref:Putative secreted protein (Por secretion system target) n=1 Tax=Chryseobacterium defluvii TaxID=160396 RepID=A0A495SMD7_9FLAO|nr:T9SS type A sorting domain-containing protein [Chryseobacterium defluvii]RKT00875.1 putative secreted protein (Por secretion system target) [Chryseobacterium defluvii]